MQALEGPDGFSLPFYIYDFRVLKIFTDFDQFFLLQNKKLPQSDVRKTFRMLNYQHFGFYFIKIGKKLWEVH